MKYKIGASFLTDNSATHSERVDVERDRRGRQVYVVRTVTVSGVLTGANAAAVETAKGTLESLLAGADGSDLARYTTAGVLVETILDDSASVDGTQFGMAQYDRAEGPENDVFRSYTFTATARFDHASQTAVREFEETWTFDSSQAPKFGFIEGAFGLPVLQQRQEHAVYRATQSGRLLSVGSRVDPPEPTYPGLPYEERKSKSVPTVDNDGSAKEYETTWEYAYESAFPFPDDLEPTVWKAS